MREFFTGATRDSDDNKLDIEGFISPLVIHAFAEYMHRNRVQADGKLRASDNWQRGIPTSQYMKSAWRHFLDVWAYHRGVSITEHAQGYEAALCALLFNVMGMLYNYRVGNTFEPDSGPTQYTYTFSKCTDLTVRDEDQYGC